MLSELDMLLLRQQLPQYFRLYYKLYTRDPRYSAAMLNDNTCVVFEGTQEVSRLTFELTKVSLRFYNLIVTDTHTKVMYDGAEMVRVVTTMSLLYLYKCKMYNVLNIILYSSVKIDTKGALYVRCSDTVFNATALDLECMNYHSQLLRELNKKSVRLTSQNIQHMPDDLLRMVGETILHETDMDYLKHCAARRLGDTIIDAIYINNGRYPDSFLTISDNKKVCTVHNHYGNSKYICSYLVDAMLETDRLDRDFYINDIEGWCRNIHDITHYIDFMKYITVLPLTRDAYVKLGEAICSV